MLQRPPWLTKTWLKPPRRLRLTAGWEGPSRHLCLKMDVMLKDVCPVDLGYWHYWYTCLCAKLTAVRKNCNLDHFLYIKVFLKIHELHVLVLFTTTPPRYHVAQYVSQSRISGLFSLSQAFWFDSIRFTPWSVAMVAITEDQTCKDQNCLKKIALKLSTMGQKKVLSVHWSICREWGSNFVLSPAFSGLWIKVRHLLQTSGFSEKLSSIPSHQSEQNTEFIVWNVRADEWVLN